MLSARENNKTGTINSIVKVAFSNFLKLLAGILAGFILPKVMSVSDYGYYKTFTLYSTYLSLLHFGFIDGIYLKFAGQDYEKLNKNDFRFYTRFLISLESLLSLVGLAVSFFFVSFELRMIWICLAIYLISNNITCYFQFVSQITSRFKELSMRNTLLSIFQSASIFVFFALYKLTGSNIRFHYYLFVYVAISIILLIIYFLTYKDIVFGKCFVTSNMFKDIASLLKIGIPLLIANICSTLILTIDRQFVNIAFNIETYSIYAFAYNMMSLITTVLAAISTVLYPTLKKLSGQELRNKYSTLVSSILIVSLVGLMLYFPLVLVVEGFLPKYINSLITFRIMLPSIAITSPITIVMHNYYKTIGKNNIFFAKSVLILCISIIANIIAFYCFHSTAAISIASLIVSLFWYFLCEFYFIKRYRIPWVKNVLYLFAMIIVFYCTTFFIDIRAGFVIYLFFVIFMTVFFFKKELKAFIKKRSF